MTQRYWTPSLRRKVGGALIALGMIVWVVSGTLRFDTRNGRDVSMPHFEARALAVIGGGAAAAGGILLLATAV
jgi:hypothetical protein